MVLYSRAGSRRFNVSNYKFVVKMNDNHRVDASWRFIACPNRKLTQLAVKHIPSVRFLLVNPIPRFACVRKHPPATRQLFFRLCCETKLQEIVDTHTHMLFSFPTANNLFASFLRRDSRSSNVLSSVGWIRSRQRAISCRLEERVGV